MMKNFTTFNDYLPNNLRNQLLEIALNDWNTKQVYFQPCGKRGYFNINDRYSSFLPEIENILGNIMSKFNVPIDGYKSARHFVGINITSAFVTPHTDVPQFIDNYTPEHKSWPEVRFNTFLQRPEAGGVPIIDNTPVPLDQGQALAFRANVVHSTTPVIGSTTRVMFSIGSIVNPIFTSFLDKN
jgi:hypothetical protein